MPTKSQAGGAIAQPSLLQLQAQQQAQNRTDPAEIVIRLSALESVAYAYLFPQLFVGSGLVPPADPSQLAELLTAWEYLLRLEEGLKRDVENGLIPGDAGANREDVLRAIHRAVCSQWATANGGWLYVAFLRWIGFFQQGVANTSLPFPRGSGDMSDPWFGPIRPPAPIPVGPPAGGGGGGGGGPNPPSPPPTGKRPHTTNDPVDPPGGHPNPPPTRLGNQGKVVGDQIVRPNQQKPGGGDGDIDRWIDFGDQGGGGSEIAKMFDKGTGDKKGPPGVGPSGPPGGQGHGPTSQNAPPGYNQNNNSDPYGGQGQETDRSQTSRDSSGRQTQKTQPDTPDQDGQAGAEDTQPDQDGEAGAQDAVTGNVSDTSGGSIEYGDVTTGGGYELPDPSGTYAGGSMPDPNDDGGGGSEGPSFTPGFHFTPHGGNTGGSGAPDPVDMSWSPEGRSDPFSALLAGAGGGGGDDWGGNNPHFNPGELADPETTGSYAGDWGYKPDPEATGPGNPRSYSGKQTKASRFLGVTRSARLLNVGRKLRYR